MVFWTGIAAVVMGVATLCAAGGQTATLADEEWELFKVQYNKSYESYEMERIRREIFLHNKVQILHHTQRYKQNLTSFDVAMNDFGDKLKWEITILFTAPLELRGFNTGNDSIILAREEMMLPSTVDWRKKGAVTGIKNQFQCASGWAFATTGSLEGQMFRHGAPLISLSEQNLIDCCHLCYGCRGGRMDYAFTYVTQNGGLDSESSYPYEARDSVCRYRPAASVARITGYTTIPPGDERALKTAVAIVGPIAVAIDASLSSFHYYTHGVYYDPNCSSSQLTHGVLIVGYGTEGGRDYWLVKNSWGTNWGDNGYIKMARNLNNNCGIATAASYPLL